MNSFSKGRSLCGLASVMAALSSVWAGGSAPSSRSVAGDPIPKSAPQNPKTAPSSSPSNPGRPMETLFNARTQVLSNGLRVIVVEDHDVPRVSVGVLFNVGSADDSASLFGLSHMAEHMYFKGTEKYPQPDVTVSQLGGSTNAFTSRDCTMFTTDIPAQSLSTILDLEADRLSNATKISMKEFQKERDAVFEERLMRVDNDPLGPADEHISATLSPLHPYGKEIIGTAQNIRAYRAKDILDHYRTWYTPENATLIVVGDADADDVFERTERLFGNIPSHPVPPRVRPDTYALRWDMRKEIVYTTDKVATPKITFLYNTPHHRSFSDGQKTLDGWAFAAAFEVAAQALFDSWVYEFGRFFIDKKPMIFSFNYDLSRGLDPDPFSVSATLRPGVSLEKFRKAFAARLARVLKKGLSREDFDRAKRFILFHFRYELPDSHDAIRTFFTRLAKGVTFEEAVALPTFIQNVTYEQANAALRVVFGQDPCATVIIQPRKEEKKYPDEEIGGTVERGGFPMRLVTEEAARAFGVPLPQATSTATPGGQPQPPTSSVKRCAHMRKEMFFRSFHKSPDELEIEKSAKNGEGTYAAKMNQEKEILRYQKIEEQLHRQELRQERERQRALESTRNKNRFSATGEWKTEKGQECFVPLPVWGDPGFNPQEGR